MNEVPRNSNAEKSDNHKPAGELLPQIYDELRRLAASKLANEAPGQTLQTTALVHEAYLRLALSIRMCRIASAAAATN